MPDKAMKFCLHPPMDLEDFLDTLTHHSLRDMETRMMGAAGPVLKQIRTRS
jgi:hypothetical protein